jgi:hypothetical protein
MSEPMNAKSDDEPPKVSVRPPGQSAPPAPAEPSRFDTRVIGGAVEGRPREGEVRQEPLRGKVLGTFRNTYYDFPNETEFKGDKVPLRDARCGTIGQVPGGTASARIYAPARGRRSASRRSMRFSFPGAVEPWGRRSLRF